MTRKTIHHITGHFYNSETESPACQSELQIIFPSIDCGNIGVVICCNLNDKNKKVTLGTENHPPRIHLNIAIFLAF